MLASQSVAMIAKNAMCDDVLIGAFMMSDGGKQKSPGDKRLIRNSTAEFLMFTGDSGDQSIEARYEDETIWLSQKLMAALFNVKVHTINEHLKKIFEQGEVSPKSTIRKFRIVQTEGSCSVTRNIDFYSLDAIISVGYRVNSMRATQFRQWATQVLRAFAIKGYVLDKKRMENGSYLGEDYFEPQFPVFIALNLRLMLQSLR